MVSVVIPCFNAQATLEATLASALAQPEAHEVIAVDDGSSDRTPAILDDLARRDARLRVIHQRNAGVASARNTGILAARGKTLAFLDSDDLWHCGHLAAHTARLESDPALGISFSRARFIDAAGRQTGLARPKLQGLAPVDFLTGNPCTTCSTMVVRRQVFTAAGLFEPKLRRSEDQEWLFRVAATTPWHISGLDAVLVDCRSSPSGLASDFDGLLRNFENVLAQARRVAPDLVDRYEPIARARTLRFLARRALRLGVDRQTARTHIRRALACAPSLMLSEPRATFATLLGALLPRHPLIDRALS